MVTTDRQNQVSHRIVEWQYRPFGERLTTIPITVFDNNNLLPSDQVTTPSLYFPGYGEKDWGITQALTDLAKQGYHVIGVNMPFRDNRLPAKRNAMIDLATEAPHVIALEIGRDYQLQNPINAAGLSQGGAVLGRAIRLDQSTFGDAAFVESAEMQSGASLHTKKERWRVGALGLHLGQSAFYQDRLDPAVWRSLTEILGEFVGDTRSRKLIPKVGGAATGSITGAVVEHARLGNNVLLILGGSDRAFPPKNAITAVTEAAAEPLQVNQLSMYNKNGSLGYIVVPGYPHLAGSTRQGKELLHRAFDHLGRPDDPSISQIQIFPIATN